MTPIAWMIGLSLVSWTVITIGAAEPVNPELLWGMIGPLASAVITWFLVVRAHQTAPERVTGVLIAGFAAKIVFFGLYLAVMIRVVELRVVPFAVAFVGYVIALYALEALFLKRLFAGSMRPSPGA
jgi:F0F1-type ATP synthase assembly protein I